MSRKKMHKELFEAEREQRYLEATTPSKPSSEGIERRGLLPFVMQPDNVLVALKRRVLPPQQQTVKAKRLRFLVFDLAARITGHARTLYSLVKAATIERLTLFKTRRRLQRLRREIAHRPRVPIPV